MPATPVPASERPKLTAPSRPANANFSCAGIRFRIRFLYKSHLATHRMSEAYYGCLFCAHARAVPHEGDATVFANKDALFRHLARHPRPLPAVPGLTVLYGDKLYGEGTDWDSDLHFNLNPDPARAAAADDHAPCRRRQDYDLHFLDPPPAPGPPPPTGLPAATATRAHRSRPGSETTTRGQARPPGPNKPGGGPGGPGSVALLAFFAGARIVGVEFPPCWGGKWATGWHDGAWGAFPAKCVELEPPRGLETPPRLHPAAQQQQQQRRGGGGGSHHHYWGILAGGRTGWAGSGAGAGDGVSVVARWKFEPPRTAEKGWLVFDKGETIRDVGWVDRGHWCWSGTNAKGRLGFFPRDFVHWESAAREGQDQGRHEGWPRPTTANPPGLGHGHGHVKGMKLPFFGGARSPTADSDAVSSVVEIIPR